MCHADNSETRRFFIVGNDDERLAKTVACVHDPTPDQRVGWTSMQAMTITRAIAASAWVAAVLFAPQLAHATDYAKNPACPSMRNSAGGGPLPQIPNQDDTRAAMVSNQALRDYPKAFALLQKIDKEDTSALSQLPPTRRHIDLVIDRHLTNLVWARALLGDYLEAGTVERDINGAAAVFQRAVDTSFVDDRGCTHTPTLHLRLLRHLAAMHLYGVGVPADRGKARRVLEKGNAYAKPIIKAIDENALPKTYREFLAMPLPRPTTADLQRAVYTSFGIESGPGPGSWFGTLLTTTLFCLALGVATYTAWELGVKASAPGSSSPRGIVAAYEIVRTAFGRLDVLFKGLFALFIGLSMLHYSGSSLSWVFSPWVSAAFDYAIILIMIGLMGRGAFSTIEALRRTKSVMNPQVHGTARPAPEAEAHAAARGRSGSRKLQDQMFSD